VSYVPPPAPGNCPSGKWQYANKRQARNARRRLNDTSLRIYRCPDYSWLHIGHIPQRVRNGDIDKAAWLASKGTKK
jgi:hypothetical protein